ncbi:MAG TPA: RluA family pseudouridine synthase [Polyangiaceae bacterium]
MNQKLDEEAIVRPDGIPEDAILRVLRVPAELAGMRLDRFVQSQLRSTSRTRARAIVKRGAYSVQGRARRPSERVRADERIALWRLPFEDTEGQAPLPVLYEDAHLLVIDKPPLVTVHPTARYHQNTVIKRLQAERPGEFLALIHRLDRETSGILLLARSLDAERAFKRKLEERSLSQQSDEQRGVEKIYLAVTRGVPPNGLVDVPMETDIDNPLRVKMRIASPGSGLDARTSLTVRETRGGYALVECALHTGRQHQIRLHLSHLGCPVVGDKLYGPDERLLARAADDELSLADLALLELPHHALHAHVYRMQHAVTGEPLEVVAPMPRDLAEFWANISV